MLCQEALDHQTVSGFTPTVPSSRTVLRIPSSKRCRFSIIKRVSFGTGHSPEILEWCFRLAKHSMCIFIGSGHLSIDINIDNAPILGCAVTVHPNDRWLTAMKSEKRFSMWPRFVCGDDQLSQEPRGYRKLE